jgi:hypothetical protein
MPTEIELPPLTPDEEPYTPQSLRTELLDSQRRDRVSVRVDLCQEFGGERRHGPLHLFVNGRRLFALQLYLLLLCLAKGDPWDKEISGTSWALALDQQGPGAESKVSRNWSWLAGNNLVRTERRGRHLQVFRLHESGNGEEFTRPTGHFFYFPFAYFTEEWHTKLSLAATATLLISLSSSRNKPWFALPLEQAADWFSISADTLNRGFDELRDHGLVTSHLRRVRDPRARGGTKPLSEYTLLGSFRQYPKKDQP